mmetsp:Transcript_82683/g.234241  ORF Transcript_82683/g.234241 Transcript_82683/m.234241 type:complete len:296 (-) Transcript_82683:1018-1905(-)
MQAASATLPGRPDARRRATCGKTGLQPRAAHWRASGHAGALRLCWCRAREDAPFDGLRVGASGDRIGAAGSGSGVGASGRTELRRLPGPVFGLLVPGLRPQVGQHLVDVPVRAPRLVEKDVDVNVPGLAPEPRAAVDELVEAQRIAVFSCEELKDQPGHGHVQAECPEVGAHLGRSEVRLELIPSQHTGLVPICFLEECLGVLQVRLERGHLHLDLHLSVLGNNLARGCDECANDHVHDADHHEEHVEDEQGPEHPMNLLEGIHGVFPADPSSDGHEEGDHGPVHTAVVVQQAVL